MVGRVDHRVALRAEQFVPSSRDEHLVDGAAALGLAQVALRAGLILIIVVAASDCVVALVAGAGALTVVEGAVLTGLGLAGAIRPDVAARLLRPQGRIVILAALFCAAAALDERFYDHFAEVGEAIVLIATLVSGARWVALCLTVSFAGYLGSLAIHGNSLAWMVGDGSYIIASQLVTLTTSALAGLLMIVLLKRFLASAPQRLATMRAGGPSLTPQLALAASGQHVALLQPAHPRTLIAPLSRAEQDVLALLSAGRVPKQVARDLSIALPTVRSRIAAAKRKTGARTLDQLVGLYARAEL